MTGNTLIMLIIAACSIMPACSYAQSISLHVQTPEGLVSEFDVEVGERFSVVTILDTGGDDLFAAEWVQTQLTVVSPGIFTLGRYLICGMCSMFSEFRYGEYVVPMDECLPAAPDYPMVRIEYLDFTGSVAPDTVMQLRGLQPGDSQPSSFNGSMGFVDCADEKHAVEMVGGPTLITGSGVIVPSGALVLNGTPEVRVGSGTSSFARVKARFR
jgi:hypothetical protein